MAEAQWGSVTAWSKAIHRSINKSELITMVPLVYKLLWEVQSEQVVWRLCSDWPTALTSLKSSRQFHLYSQSADDIVPDCIGSEDIGSATQNCYYGWNIGELRMDITIRPIFSTVKSFLLPSTQWCKSGQFFLRFRFCFLESAINCFRFCFRFHASSKILTKNKIWLDEVVGRIRLGFGRELDLRIICPIELILSGFNYWLKILITFLKESIVKILPGSGTSLI